MKIDVTKTISGWSPIDDKSKSYHKKFKLGDIYHIDVTHYKNQRNAKLNSKYWKMLSVVVENSAEFKRDEDLHYMIKRCFRITEEVYNPVKKEIELKIGSTSFDKMSDDDFNKFYSDAVSFCCKYVITGTDEEELKQAVDQLLPFF